MGEEKPENIKYWEYTYPLRRLLLNEGFRTEFLQRFCSHASITFSPQRVLPLLEQARKVIEPEMPRHIPRWQWPDCGFEKCFLADMDTWYSNLEVIRDFSRQRAASILEHIRNYFHLPGMFHLTVKHSMAGGSIKIPEVYLPVIVQPAGFQSLPLP